MYTLEKFGQIRLPRFNTTEEISPRKRRSSTIELPSGGFYRHRGMAKARAGLSTIKKTGEMIRGLDWEETTGLFGMIGSVDKLWRRDQDNDRVQWAWAELQNISSSRTARYSPIMPIEMSFLILSPWHGHIHEGPWLLYQNKPLDEGWFLDEPSNQWTFSGSPIAIELPSGGNAVVEDARVLVNATTEIPGFSLAGVGIHLNYTASIPSGRQLVLNCGTRQITRSDSNSSVYRYLRLGSGHKQANWLPIRPDGTNLMFNPSGGHGNIRFFWSDCWE